MKLHERILYQFFVGIFYGAAVAQADNIGVALLLVGSIIGFLVFAK